MRKKSTSTDTDTDTNPATNNSNTAQENTNMGTQTANSAFADRLNRLKSDNYEDQLRAATDNRINKVEPGTYAAVLNKAEVNESGAGNLQIAWEFTIAEGENFGEPLRIYQGLEDTETRKDVLKYVFQNLNRLGVDLAGFDIAEHLEATLAELVERHPVVEMKVVEKAAQDGRTFQNTYINKVLANTQDEFQPA